jgi:hypothetical protein
MGIKGVRLKQDNPGSNTMRMQVGPAKREGTRRTIFHRPLNSDDFRPGSPGAMIVSVDAEGIYSDGSKYRYLMEFTLEELRSVIKGLSV